MQSRPSLQSHSLREIGFNWRDLADDALIVDVGGGVGSQCMVLADAFKDCKFRFVVQDRQSVIKEAATVSVN